MSASTTVSVFGKRHLAAEIQVKARPGRNDDEQRSGREPPSHVAWRRLRFRADSREILTRLGGGLVASRPVLFQRSGDDRVQSTRNRSVQIVRWNWRLIENRLVDRRPRLAEEGALSSSHLIKTRPKEKRIVRMSNGSLRTCSGDM